MGMLSCSSHAEQAAETYGAEKQLRSHATILPPPLDVANQSPLGTSPLPRLQ